MPAVLFVQLGCDADVGTDTIKKKKIFTLSVRLFFNFDHSFLQFMVLLSVAKGSSTAKERTGQDRTPRCKGRIRLERASPFRQYDLQKRH